jgi:hypothetical protein
MPRIRVLLPIALGLVVAFLLVLHFFDRAPVLVQQQPTPILAPPPGPDLQANAEGSYLPGYKFTVNGFQFAGFSLHPGTWVTFAQTRDSIEHSAPCAEATISPDTVHLRCDYPGLGVVTIDGNFLTRIALLRSDTAVVSAVVTVTAGGQTLHSKRDSFIWVQGD